MHEGPMGAIALDRIGDVVLAFGSPRFGTEYYKLFRESLGIDTCTVFAFAPDGIPTPLVAECDSRDGRQQAWDLALEYSQDAFKHDPIIRGNRSRISKGSTPVLYSLRADQVKDVAYRRHFYDEPALHQKVGILGRVGETLYYSNFYCGLEHRGFSESDALLLLRDLAGLALKLVHRHAVRAACSPTGLETPFFTSESDPTVLLHLRDVFLEEPVGLSPREAEVCAHIVLGYSALAIGLNLGIAVSTVATHRKRAYRKLDVCSQNELFQRYFRTVNKMMAERRH
jgi:DNA-binding CsgD family transcriptional regulator